MFTISGNALATNFGDECEAIKFRHPRRRMALSLGEASFTVLVNEFQRRLIVYTCGPLIEIPYTYTYISGLRKDFSNIVSYSRISIDFVFKKLKLQSIYSIWYSCLFKSLLTQQIIFQS